MLSEASRGHLVQAELQYGARQWDDKETATFEELGPYVRPAQLHVSEVCSPPRMTRVAVNGGRDGASPIEE